MILNIMLSLIQQLLIIDILKTELDKKVLKLSHMNLEVGNIKIKDMV